MKAKRIKDFCESCGEHRNNGLVKITIDKETKTKKKLCRRCLRRKYKILYIPRMSNIKNKGELK